MPAHLLNKARHEREPWGIWLFARAAWNSFRRASAGLRRWWRLLRIQHSGVDRTRPWRDRPWLMVVTALTVFLALIFLAWLGRSLYVLIDRSKNAAQWPYGFSPDRWCSAKGVECGALTGWVTSLLSIALASAAFLLWRLDRVRHRYLRLARRTPRELVPTAGTIIGKIVGRDQLCLAVMEDLRVRPSRRPHVLIGGVGTGKTAVIVQLTELLAKRNAVPVPIRLRETEGLDFMALAKKRFLDQIDDWMTSGAEAEKTWRRMHRDGRIVVLADGLEEALAGDPEKNEEGKLGERDTQIRNAIRDAHRRGLALFVASRPHSPLRGMDATIHELEPLSENDALSYIQEETPTEDDWRLSWIVEMAGAAEAPLYLQITRELSRLDMLDRIARREDQLLQTGTQDRSSLRLRLLETWEEALIRGRLFPEVPLSPAERQATLDWISALACAGLMMDSIEVSLETKLNGGIEQEVQRRAKSAEAATPGWRGLSGIDRQLAASWGAQLGLIELGANRVRFQHSLIEAYLGSRLMDVALSDLEYRREALSEETASGRRPRPGREFLISLVLHSREGAGAQVPGSCIASEGQPQRISRVQLCSWLLDAAAEHKPNNKALDIYAAALEIAGAPDQPGTCRPSAPGRAHVGFTETRIQEHGRQVAIQAAEFDPGPTGPEHESGIGAALEDIPLSRIGDKISINWKNIRSDDLATLEEAKIGLVLRFGEASRNRNDPTQSPACQSGYQQLYEICCQEDSYRVRLAGAQEMGRGGCTAYQELQSHLAVPGTNWPGPQAPHDQQSASDPQDVEYQWARQVSAWVLPLLVTSVDPDSDDRDQAGPRQDLRTQVERWVGHVGPADPDRYPDEVRLTISEEIALAQGFKYAANHRHRHLHTRPDAWSYLESQAQEMLKHASYWFSELTLIQALALWALPEGTEPLPASAADDDSAISGRPRQNPDRTVERWLEIIADKPAVARRGPKARPVHQLVDTAAELASRALAIQQPGRFLWMDENDAVSRIGAGQPKATPLSARKPPLWIPPSAGWSALDPEAQQLLADVIVLLNLAERGEAPKDAEARLRQLNQHELPPCITRDRRPLEPLHTVGTAESHQPGSSCLDGCRFQLCPYPPKGLQHRRAELSEEFCRRQYRLARRYFKPGRHTARWQGMWAGRLRKFWLEMAERARINAGGPPRPR
jgi:hypothetical protein